MRINPLIVAPSPQKTFAQHNKWVENGWHRPLHVLIVKIRLSKIVGIGFKFSNQLSFSCRGHGDLLGPKETRCTFVSYLFLYTNMTSDPWSHGELCVAGREGSWSGRPRWTGRTSRFEGPFQIVFIPVSHHMCHSPQTNCGLISGRSRPSRITWSYRATGEAWCYWATRSERWNRTDRTSWSTRKCGWCSCCMGFHDNPATSISECFWFQGAQGFTGNPGKAGPAGPPGPPGQAVSLYCTLRGTGWDV